jgi:hypothetical protein
MVMYASGVPAFLANSTSPLVAVWSNHIRLNPALLLNPKRQIRKYCGMSLPAT